MNSSQPHNRIVSQNKIIQINYQIRLIMLVSHMNPHMLKQIAMKVVMSKVLAPDRKSRPVTGRITKPKFEF
jgi:hypothetical protein